MGLRAIVNGYSSVSEYSIGGFCEIECEKMGIVIVKDVIRLTAVLNGVIDGGTKWTVLTKYEYSRGLTWAETKLPLGNEVGQGHGRSSQFLYFRIVELFQWGTDEYRFDD